MTFGERLFAAMQNERQRFGSISQERWIELANATAADWLQAQKSKPRAVGAPKARNKLFDALAQACGFDLEHITRAAGSTIATALRDIHEASPDLTCALIEHAAIAHKRRFPTIAVTPSSLAKWWGILIGTGQQTRTAKLDPYQEPADWKFTAERMHPGTDIAARAWNDVPLDVRGSIVKEIAKLSA